MRADDAEDMQWRKESNKMRDSLRAPPVGCKGANPWTSMSKLRGVPPSPRMRDAIDVCYFSMGGDVKGMLLDLSQSVSRKAWARQSSRALAARTLIYSFDLDGVLDPKTAARLQGLPETFLHAGLSDDQLRSLAGEAVFLPNLATILWAAFIDEASPWSACQHDRPVIDTDDHKHKKQRAT